MGIKYIFVTGGVVSGLGKGITAASLGRLLKARGYKVTNQKFDPYINIDPATISPYQHGEVFVTEDGAETDLDLGHYERFVDENLSVNSSVTAGKIYWSVLNRERKGEYQGATVQVIPHITNAIKEFVYRAGRSSNSDIVITEIGGTVGDIEGLPFLEAIRQVGYEVGRANTLYVHVTLLPLMNVGGEMKTKPTQHSVKELLSLGIQPDIIVCRTGPEIPDETREKLALFCNVPKDHIIQNADTASLYEIPLKLEEDGFARRVCDILSLDCHEPDFSEWKEIITREKNRTKKIKVALIGTYVSLHDAYLSIVESLNHAGIWNGSHVEIMWVDSEEVNAENVSALIGGANAAVVPCGFDERGIDGKLAAVRFLRENKIPVLGIGLGMQCMAIEFARNAAGLEGAYTAEIRPDAPHPVISAVNGRKAMDGKCGARLGVYPCKIAKDTALFEAYGSEIIYERHKHGYGFNMDYKNVLAGKGLVFSGISPDETLAEAIELPRGVHPWFVGVQFRPEFKSRPNRPHPLFAALLRACGE